MLHEEFDDQLFWGKEDWEVDDSLACVLDLIERDEYDTVKELENQFDSVWIDVSGVSFVQTCIIHLSSSSSSFVYRQVQKSHRVNSDR